MDEPKFIDVIRNPDGTANWRLNFDIIWEAYNAALFHFQHRDKADKVLIEFLIELRRRAKERGAYAHADEIRVVLQMAGVVVKDYPTYVEWHIECSPYFGKVPIK